MNVGKMLNEMVEKRKKEVCLYSTRQLIPMNFSWRK